MNSIFPLIVYSAIGLMIYDVVTDADNRHRIDESQITIPQLIFFRFLCGPLIWVYGFWRLLGLWGKKD